MEGTGNHIYRIFFVVEEILVGDVGKISSFYDLQIIFFMISFFLNKRKTTATFCKSFCDNHQKVKVLMNRIVIYFTEFITTSLKIYLQKMIYL